MHFEWIPGQGMHLDALERMKQHFPRPIEAPPIAWFMSPVQKYFSELLKYQPNELPCFLLENYLDDTGTGIRNFGRYEIWVQWYQYLLPYALPRFQEDSILELLI
jgi:hypothetical protein